MKRIAIAIASVAILGATVVAAQSPTPPSPPIPAVAPLPPDDFWEAEVDPLDDMLWLDDDVLAFTPQADAMAWSGDNDVFVYAPRAKRDRVVSIHRSGHSAPRARHRMHRLNYMAAELDLTDAQREKMRDIADRQKRQSIKARADMDIARMDLRELMREDEAELPKINAQIDKISKMRADMEKSNAGMRIEMRSVLTPEQKQKLKEARRGDSRKMRAPGSTPAPSEGSDT
jgi:Spy/CpxP family protein refolding chaperone